MCGIAGSVLLDGRRIDRRQLAAQTRCLAHRGPDGEGLWTSPGGHVGLGHRRLAIIDLSPAAAQPMSYADRFTITYNGEIYNYVELREDLVQQGHRFRTSSDTEVVMAAYAQYGPECLSRFDGMFAFALWDEAEQCLFCARDRLGEKPFYYHYRPGQHFVFASEMKALFAAGVERSVHDELLFQYLAYDVVQDPSHSSETFYKEVTSLEPAHTVVLKGGVLGSPRRYWQIDPTTGASTLPLAEASEKLRGLLTESIRRRLRSDVSVGASLSGGLDSSSIVCLVRALIGPSGPIPDAFSARFAEPALDEGRHIETVTRATGINSHVTWPDGAGLARDIDRLFYHQEEPFGTASIYAQWTVMRLAKEVGTTVLLDGQGPDEMLGGYTHFVRSHLKSLYKNNRAEFKREAPAYGHNPGLTGDGGWRFRLDATAPPSLRRRLGAFRRAFLAPAALSWLSSDFCRPFRRLTPPFRAFDDLSGVLRFFTQDYGLRNLLRFADRNSMAFGREVRLPFLFHELVEFVFTLPDDFKIKQGQTKKVLRAAVAGVVPESIRLRVDKIGLDTPQATWLEEPAMVERIHEATRLLQDQGLIRRKPVPKEAVWRVLMAALLLRTSTGEPGQ